MYPNRSRSSASKAALFIASILLNFALSFACDHWSIPLMMDSVGTIYAAMVLGPVPAIVIGLVNSLIMAFFFTGLPSLWFFAVSVIVALVVGISMEERIVSSFTSACGLTFLLFLLTTISSALLTLMTLGGTPNHPVGALIYQALTDGAISPFISTFVSIGAIRLPDMILTMLLAGAFYFFTPANVRGR